ncbi:TrkA family potassium uptake protein [Mycoplasma sp. Mirounga ES2805-ORL]|uniref:potassium channel family protein n=1 Tax=Mycoplasma sp. Mirounga ES2805-ORL TaxID=754514 RepID=UPI00197C4975|nr:TrkA family potassium uptake protein [Mycoplasma sp. Mirounga ES2805-ORL]QSF13822.1 TrkA family potassium uptake protein [Mycoplasma sp. Mirounga ES2805-ORL]
MKRKIEDICVIGAGRFGSAVIEQLAKEGSNILIIDKNEELLKNFGDVAKKIAVADAAEIKTLKALNVEAMDSVVVSVPDNIEIIAALLELNIKNIIARATSERHARVLKKIGVNVIIRPEFEAGVRTAILATNSNFIKYSKNLQEIGDNFVMGTSKISNPNLVDKPIKDLDFVNWGITLVLVKRGIEMILPNGLTILRKDDLVTIIGKVSNVTNAMGKFNEE